MRFPPVAIAAVETVMAPAPLNVMSDDTDRNPPENVRLPTVEALVMASVSLNWMPVEMRSFPFAPSALLIAADPLEASMMRFPLPLAAKVKAFVVVVSPMFSVPAVRMPFSVAVRGAVRTLLKLRMSPARPIPFGEMAPAQLLATLVFPVTSVQV